MSEATVTMWLSPARPFDLQALARSFDERFGARVFVTAEQLDRLIAPAPAELAELLTWTSKLGLERVPDDPAPVRRLRFNATIERLRDAFGDAALRALARRELGAPAIASTDVLPPRLRGLVARVELSPGPARRWRRELVLDAASERAPPRPDRCGVTPTELERTLAIPPNTDGDGQRMAMMALGGLPRGEDLDGFRRSFAGPQPRLQLVELGPMSATTRDDPLFRHETTMSIEWITALAPASELCVYLIDPRHVADPWVAFFEAALADDATIATTAWSSPEHQYYASHGRSVAASLLDQLAARGCTVLAASGDWGPCAGAPRVTGDVRACARPWPGVAFPCSEPRVLGIGGTQDLADPELLRAVLSRDLAERLGLREVASGGGFSESVAIPAWQAPSLARQHPRDQDAPAVAPSGRGVPDLALPAWSVPGPAGSGFSGLIDGRWRDDIGGTSFSVAVAAACFARVNQILERRGRPRVGSVAPHLYRLAQRDSSLLRAIERGTTSIELPCLDERGAPTWRTIPGFVAQRGWTPAAGLGIPNFSRLLDVLCDAAGER